MQTAAPPGHRHRRRVPRCHQVRPRTGQLGPVTATVQVWATTTPGPLWSGTALVVRGSHAVEERSVGLTNRPGSQPCSPRSRFQACSISKLVLSTVVLSLVEAGALDLQLPINTWLEDVPTSWSTITMHHLLSNTSGLGHWGDIPGLPRLLTAPPPYEELLALVAAAPPVDPPGADWAAKTSSASARPCAPGNSSTPDPPPSCGPVAPHRVGLIGHGFEPGGALQRGSSQRGGRAGRTRAPLTSPHRRCPHGAGPTHSARPAARCSGRRLDQTIDR